MSFRARARAARRKAEVAAQTLRESRGRHGSGRGSDPLAALGERDHEDFKNMRRLLAFVLQPQSSCVDVGAHRGAVLAEMLRVAPDGHHLAIEPIPHLARELRETFPQVAVHECALSSKSGRSSFAHVRGSAEGWSGLRFRPLPTGEDADLKMIDVRIEVLDDLLEPDYKPAVIKVDVEGAEQQVLQGALQTLRRHRPLVIFEHGSGSAETFGTYPSDIYGLLVDSVGYRIFDLDGTGPYTLADFEHTFYTGARVNFIAHP